MHEEEINVDRVDHGRFDLHRHGNSGVSCDLKQSKCADAAISDLLPYQRGRVRGGWFDRCAGDTAWKAWTGTRKKGEGNAAVDEI